MIRLLLDTSICIDLLRGRNEAARRRLRRYAVGDVGVSSITFAELSLGAARSSDPARHAVLIAKFCAPLSIASFDAPAAEAYGPVRASLERAGTPIGPLDTLIAAHAVALGVPLVTGNEREFRRVAGLTVRNWARA